MDYSATHPELSIIDEMPDPLEQLRAIDYMQGVLEARAGRSVRDAREWGHTWPTIAAALVTSEAGARKRFRYDSA